MHELTWSFNNNKWSAARYQNGLLKKIIHFTVRCLKGTDPFNTSWSLSSSTRIAVNGEAYTKGIASCLRPLKRGSLHLAVGKRGKCCPPLKQNLENYDAFIFVFAHNVTILSVNLHELYKDLLIIINVISKASKTMIKKIIKYHKRHLKGTGPFKSLFLSVVFYAFAVTGEAIRRAFQVVCAQVKRGITTGGCWKDEVCQLQHNLELWRPHFVFAHNVTILSKFSIQFLFPFLFSLSHETKRIKKI